MLRALVTSELELGSSARAQTEAGDGVCSMAWKTVCLLTPDRSRAAAWSGARTGKGTVAC